MKLALRPRSRMIARLLASTQYARWSLRIHQMKAPPIRWSPQPPKIVIKTWSTNLYPRHILHILLELRPSIGPTTRPSNMMARFLTSTKYTRKSLRFHPVKAPAITQSLRGPKIGIKTRSAVLYVEINGSCHGWNSGRNGRILLKCVYWSVYQNCYN